MTTDYTMVPISLKNVRQRATALGYGVACNKKDIQGNVRRYQTYPTDGSGSINYFDSLTRLNSYCAQVEESRRWQNFKED